MPANQVDSPVNKPIPPQQSLLLLLLAVLSGLFLGAVLSMLINWATGFEMKILLETGAKVTDNQRLLAKLNLIIHHLFTFLFPGLLVAYLLFRPHWGPAFGLPSQTRPLNLVLSAGIMICLPALVALTYWLNKQISLPGILSQTEDRSNQLITELLNISGPGDFLLNLLVMAIIPALGEEFIFRGHLQVQLGRWLKRPEAGIWLAAFLFSAMHLQFEGFLPRFLLGLVLGYFFYWTGNLWIAIWGHFVNNAMQLIGALYLGENAETMDISQVELPDPWQLLIFTTLAALLFYQLRRSNSHEPGVDHERT